MAEKRITWDLLKILLRKLYKKLYQKLAEREKKNKFEIFDQESQSLTEDFISYLRIYVGVSGTNQLWNKDFFVPLGDDFIYDSKDDYFKCPSSAVLSSWEGYHAIYINVYAPERTGSVSIRFVERERGQGYQYNEVLSSNPHI